jgi:hypothetical protein
MSKRKNKNLVWYAFREDFNSNELERFNVLYSSFADEILKRVKRNKIDTYDKFKEQVRSILMYNYWSKSEHEVLVTSLSYRPDRDKVSKIDVWYQLEPNLDRICEYIIRELLLEF